MSTTFKGLLVPARRRVHSKRRMRIYDAFISSFFQPHFSRAIRGDPQVPLLELQCTLINVTQFTSVARRSELLDFHIEDLRFSGNSVSNPVVGVLPITKRKRCCDTYFRWTRAVDVSVSGLSALQVFLCVLRKHNMDIGYIFKNVTSNPLRFTYKRTLISMSKKCGIPEFAEHSTRRGGAGYLYFVLRLDLVYIYRAFSLDS